MNGILKWQRWVDAEWHRAVSEAANGRALMPGGGMITRHLGQWRPHAASGHRSSGSSELTRGMPLARTRAAKDHCALAPGMGANRQ
jgi:hypothetical protein